MFDDFDLCLKANKNLVGNSLALAGGQLGSKSPNLQSPSAISVTKPIGVVDPLALGSLPSSIASSAMSVVPNSAGLQSMSGNVMSIANNGSSPQVMSSIQGEICH